MNKKAWFNATIIDWSMAKNQVGLTDEELDLFDHVIDLTDDIVFQADMIDFGNLLDTGTNACLKHGLEQDIIDGFQSTYNKVMSQFVNSIPNFDANLAYLKVC